jgi:hypothetical protein
MLSSNWPLGQQSLKYILLSPLQKKLATSHKAMWPQKTFYDVQNVTYVCSERHVCVSEKEDLVSSYTSGCDIGLG